MTAFRDKNVLITGAASGIGRLMASRIGAEGGNLILWDVNRAGLDETKAELEAAGRKVHAYTCNLTDRRAIAEAAAQTLRECGPVDVLVNNAGVGLGGGFLDTTLEDWNWIVGINLRGVIHGCHFFVPKMVERRQGGHVVNVASAAAFIATEALAAYSTTKFAVLGLSEALRDELAPHRIGVTAICPGIINTPITGSARLRGKAATPGAREQMVAFYQKRNYGPERVAEGIVKAVARNAAVAPISPKAWVMYLMKRTVPGFTAWLNRRMAERMQRQLEASKTP